VYLKKLFFLTSLVAGVGLASVFGQKLSPADSIKRILINTKGPGVVELYYNLGFEYYVEGKLSAAIESLELAKSSSQAFGDSLYIVKTARLSGQILRRLNKIEESVVISKSVIPIAIRNSANPDFKRELKFLYNSIGIAYLSLARYDSALESNFKNLVLREEDGDLYDIAATLNNIGVLYSKLRNYQKALEFYKRSLINLEKVEEQDFKDDLLINIGLCYNHLKEYDLARNYILDGLSFCGSDCEQIQTIEGNWGIGVSYYQTKDFNTAKEYFGKSYTLAKHSSILEFQMENLVYLIKIEMELGNLASAGEYLREAERIAEDSDFVVLRLAIYDEYAKYFTELGDYARASSYQKKYIDLTDKIFNAKLIESISKVETEFDQRENMRTIRDKELALDQSRKLNFAIAGLFLLAGALAVVMFRTTRIVRRVNVALSEARNQLEIQNKELDKLVEARTEELNRSNASLRKAVAELDHFIYKTSHDIRGPLATLKGMTDVALMDVKDPLARDYFEKLDITAEKLNSVLTRLMIVNQINNAPLVPVKVNFSQVIESVLLLERKKGIPARMNVSTFVPPDVEINSEPQLLRIVLENLIDNAIKYYNQSERVDPFVKITAVVINKQLLVEVLDNGIGISEEMKHEVFKMFTRASERSDTGGVGLYLSQQAAEKLGGSISFETTPEKYTRFTAVIPADLQKVIDSRQGGKPAGAAPAKLLKTSPDASRKAS